MALPSIAEATGHGESKLEFSLPFDTVTATSFTPYAFTNPKLIGKLTEQSADRQKDSAEMQALTKTYNRVRLSQQSKTIPLNQQKYLAAFADQPPTPPTTTPSAEKEGAKSGRTGPYLTEVLAIARDYFQLLNEAKITIDSKPAK